MLSFLSLPTGGCPDGRLNSGAGDGNRTRVASLEGWSSTIELHPPISHPLTTSGAVVGGGGRIRTYVGRSQQVYSLPPLATRAPLRAPHRLRPQRKCAIWAFTFRSQFENT